MNLSVALLCFNRLEDLRRSWASLLSCHGIEAVRLEVFSDGPRDTEDEGDVLAVRTFLQEVGTGAPFAAFQVDPSPTNLGVWKNKLRAFQSAFDRGADLVLLLEDDVVLASDALLFLEDLYPFVAAQDRLVTLGLYSTNLQASATGVPFSRAQAFLDAHPEVFSTWGARDWPFPWGLALTRKSFERFLALGWTGNDQNMGRLLRQEGGWDLFPILTRAVHRGQVSSTSGHEIELMQFYGPSVSVAQFLVGADETLESAYDRGHLYWENLKNDLGWTEFQVTLLCGPHHDSERRKRFQALYPFLRFRICEVETGGAPDRVKATLAEFCGRIYTSIFVLDLGTEFNHLAVQFLRSVGVSKIATDFEESCILELLKWE